MPKATFKITGEIDEFDRIDNLYRSLKREGEKMLKNWIIEVNAEYIETQESAKK